MKKVRLSYFLISLFLSVSSCSYSQEEGTTFNTDFLPRDFTIARVAFYNVENLFDIWDDSLKSDEDFIPGNIRGWNYNRYLNKLDNLSRVIIGLGGWSAPEIIGLCEIENKKCTQDLFNNTILSKFDYRILQFPSPDRRGIETAFVFLPEKFKPLEFYPIEINFPFSSSSTRDILYVHGLLLGSPIHFYVCHWPSKYGGEVATIEKRNHVATILSNHIDSIRLKHPNESILVMGDLNDYPESESVKEFLGASSTDSSSLINLSTAAGSWQGSHKHHGKWGYLDQIIVDSFLYNGHSSLELVYPMLRSFSPDWILENDEAYLGEKPFRSYVGMKYNGGYSDHLPVYVDLKLVLSY